MVVCILPACLPFWWRGSMIPAGGYNSRRPGAWCSQDLGRTLPQFKADTHRRAGTWQLPCSAHYSHFPTQNLLFYPVPSDRQDSLSLSPALLHACLPGLAMEEGYGTVLASLCLFACLAFLRLWFHLGADVWRRNDLRAWQHLHFSLPSSVKFGR